MEILAVVLKSEHLCGTYCMPGSVPRASRTRTPCTLRTAPGDAVVLIQPQDSESRGSCSVTLSVQLGRGMGAAPDPRGQHHGKACEPTQQPEVDLEEETRCPGERAGRPSPTGWELAQSEGCGHQWEGCGPADVLEPLGSALGQALGRTG